MKLLHYLLVRYVADGPIAEPFTIKAVVYDHESLCEEKFKRAAQLKRSLKEYLTVPDLIVCAEDFRSRVREHSPREIRAIELMTRKGRVLL